MNKEKPKTHSKGSSRPLVSLCTGMSLDGKISSFQRVDTRINTDDDRSFLYDHRVDCDAIMMGGRTMIFDDPGLTVKSPQRQKKRLALGKTKEPTKVGIVSDISKLKIDGDFFTRGDAKKIIFTTRRSSAAAIKDFKKAGDIYVYGDKKVDLKKALAKLKELGINSVLVEGGGELIFSLLKDNLVDEINLKIGDLILGGRTTATLCDGEGFSGLDARQVKLVSLKKKGSCLELKYKILKNTDK